MKHELNSMNFIDQFQSRYPFLLPNDFDTFLSITHQTKFKKGEKIIDFGEKKKKIIILLKGMVRGFIINYQGRELTTFLFQESTAFAAYEPLILGKPTHHAFECLEHSEALVLEYKDLETLTNTNTRIKKVMDSIIMDSLSIAIQRNESFIRESPEKRYLSFMKNHDDLLQRVSQKHIASYLGITAVSFSRLKKRIYMQQE